MINLELKKVFVFYNFLVYILFGYVSNSFQSNLYNNLIKGEEYDKTCFRC